MQKPTANIYQPEINTSNTKDVKHIILPMLFSLFHALHCWEDMKTTE